MFAILTSSVRSVLMGMILGCSLTTHLEFLAELEKLEKEKKGLVEREDEKIRIRRIDRSVFLLLLSTDN